MLNNGKPEIDFLMSLGNRGFGGKQGFINNYNKAKIWFTMFMMIPISLMGVFIMMLGATEREMSCSYEWDKAAYDCQITSKNFIMGTDTRYFKNIKKAVLNFENSDKGTLYQAQFLDTQDNKIAYNNVWVSPPDSVDKQIEKLNKYFNAKKDFSYDLGINLMVIFVSIPFIILPLIIFFVFRYVMNNYLFEESDLNKYKAALKIKDIGKMKLSEDQINEILYQVESSKANDSSNSFADKDREFIDRDVEDATKQFYDDGK